MNRPVTDTVALDKRSPGVKDIEPLLRPKLDVLYAHRSARLRHLAADHPEAGYLRFIAALVDRQRELLLGEPLPRPATTGPRDGASGPVRAGLDEEPVRSYWMAALGQLLDHARATAPQSVLDALEPLRRADDAARAQMAAKLLDGKSGEIGAGAALFLWTALSLTAAQYADFVLAEPQAPASRQESSLCPLCGCAPAGSLIMNGDRAGLRYLHCPLCETRWHMVRSKCSNCGSAAKLDYWSLDDLEAPVKAESCGDCHGYLKAFYRERDEHVEVCADDLATLALDAAVAQEGYGRTGVSPFAFEA
ncbi:formate dehydrogenase accessory protein FdhE [Cupriavidus sp. WS]|uniref:formate dehydrogenase accessory protein FdhE n=1 Tax=Cupriavidus sp. WS TaxID=1312922 RepID=UPI00035E54A0|nr:formate dehydrogenase accessory protein FdhE [Cupriavidus sp. WS]